jgi:hypothetical protein
MELVIFFSVFFFLTMVLGPIFGAEDRPAFRWPDRKPRTAWTRQH